MWWVEAIEPGLRPISGRSDVDLDSAFASARPRLVRIATSLVGPDAAEDVVHDTYLTARARVGQLRDPAALEAWLARICVHRPADFNHRARDQGGPDPEEDRGDAEDDPQAD